MCMFLSLYVRSSVRPCMQIFMLFFLYSIVCLPFVSSSDQVVSVRTIKSVYVSLMCVCMSVTFLISIFLFLSFKLLLLTSKFLLLTSVFILG